MTIATGFVCNEGIVLAADSQETISGYSKDLSHGKIVTGVTRTSDATGPLLSYTFVGAGDTDYIATALEKIMSSLGRCNNFLDVQPSLDKCLRRFHEERIAPWASFPISERPYVELLIGVSIGSVFGLFHSSGTALHQCDRPRAIGTGAILANTLMTQYFDFNDGVEELIKLAAFVVYKVKSHVDGCGGFTHISALRGGGDFALVDGLGEFEGDIEKIEKKCTDDFRSQLFSSTGAPKTIWMSESKRKNELSKPSN